MKSDSLYCVGWARDSDRGSEQDLQSHGGGIGHELDKSQRGGGGGEGERGGGCGVLASEWEWVGAREGGVFEGCCGFEAVRAPGGEAGESFLDTDCVRQGGRSLTYLFYPQCLGGPDSAASESFGGVGADRGRHRPGAGPPVQIPCREH